MHKDKKLYEYMLDKTWDLTEQWYESLDKSQSGGVYASTDPDVIHTLKQQNHEFHQRFCRVFQQENVEFQKEFGDWILKIAKDEEHLNTPVHLILNEFFRTQEQYLYLINEFVEQYGHNYSKEVIQSWTNIVTKTFAEVMSCFTEEHHNHLQLKLQAQQEMINELSSPVILLREQNGLLPLVGDIDTVRAKFILEHTLMQCVDKRITHLFIDLSGVVIIDTMVAHQIFQLIDALKLVGVTVTLSGIRAEIAQTAVQLGLSFGNIETTATLAQAMTLRQQPTT
ncbi:STAS domain-containing protein [Bacillus sp. CGMCC 1.16541]|uniref:STAS domain-containing protein n=1 Tax=Bacillus sp. CGMCC 1.16541 TaxID=2185143 RepID=UPI000D729049|nr:STAS domain-containing protein [Bacillus sp. CGMCC 1.16541]